MEVQRIQENRCQRAISRQDVTFRFEILRFASLTVEPSTPVSSRHDAEPVARLGKSISSVGA